MIGRPMYPMMMLLLLSLLVVAGCGPEDTPTATENNVGDEVIQGESVSFTPQGSPLIPPPVPVDCIDDVTAGQRVVKCDGLTFDLTVPFKCVDGSRHCGLVVDVHGMTMNGKMQDKNTEMAALGAKHGYIVVQPNAPGAPPFSSWAPSNDATVHGFMSKVIRAFHVDKKRVHFTGFSQGGRMTWRFIKNYPDLLASAAPAGHCFLDGMPTRPLPVLHLMGEKDWLINSMCGKAGEKIDNELAPAWKLTNKTTVAQGTDHRHLRYTGSTGLEVEVLLHQQVCPFFLAGHCFPGSTDVSGALPGQLFNFGCTAKGGPHWGKLAMQFFIDHPKP